MLGVLCLKCLYINITRTLLAKLSCHCRLKMLFLKSLNNFAAFFPPGIPENFETEPNKPREFQPDRILSEIHFAKNYFGGKIHLPLQKSQR